MIRPLKNPPFERDLFACIGDATRPDAEGTRRQAIATSGSVNVHGHAMSDPSRSRTPKLCMARCRNAALVRRACRVGRVRRVPLERRGCAWSARIGRRETARAGGFGHVDVGHRRSFKGGSGRGHSGRGSADGGPSANRDGVVRRRALRPRCSDVLSPAAAVASRGGATSAARVPARRRPSTSDEPATGEFSAGGRPRG
jgi:hypothetical protein